MNDASHPQGNHVAASHGTADGWNRAADRVSAGHMSDARSARPKWTKPKRPREWQRAVTAAAMRICGATQPEAAESAGIAVRTLKYWEHSDWWPDAVREASDTWLHELTAYARGTLLRAVRAGNSELAWRIIERTVPELRPPRLNASIGTFEYAALSNEELIRIAAGQDPERVLADRKEQV